MVGLDDQSKINTNLILITILIINLALINAVFFSNFLTLDQHHFQVEKELRSFFQ